jgi:putative CocE/NonD family hydrolase
MKRIWIGIGVVVALLAVVIALAKRPGRSTSLYLPMRDGVELAVSVYLPPDLRSGERLPVLMRTTRYWREPEIGWTARALLGLHLLHPQDLLDDQFLYFTRRRFAVLLVDARGSGASSGSRPMEFSRAEVADMCEVAAWAARQPWSNGRIGTFGISYEGNTAEMAAVPNQPAVQALMPLYDEFDQWEQIGSAGVASRSFLDDWTRLVGALDRNDVCGADGTTGWRCWRDHLMTPGVRPVDADPDGTRLAAFVKERHNVNVADAVRNIEFRDDRIPTEGDSIGIPDVSPYGMRPQIEASRAPMMVWCGWLDGDGCEGSLSRYHSFTNPQVVIMGPLSHGGGFNVDPFASNHLPPAPTADEQLRMEADFFDRVLRPDSAESVRSSIRYYTMGEGRWHTTTTWPPAGLSTRRLYFGPAHTLSVTLPGTEAAFDTYAIDFTATTGTETRWNTGLDGSDVIYPDRAAEDRKLLVYTGEPLATDLEITGTPVLSLVLASTASDGAVHAYLEDVAPEGRVTYVDEGILRVINRKEVDPKALPYLPQGPPHSYLRRDAEPLTPGMPATIRLSFYTTSVMLHRGHRIRVALAGADALQFRRYPATGTPTWTVYREAQRASFVELPVRDARP